VLLDEFSYYLGEILVFRNEFIGDLADFGAIKNEFVPLADFGAALISGLVYYFGIMKLLLGS